MDVQNVVRSTGAPAIFPIDEVTVSYLRLTGRPEAQVALVEAYAKEQGLWHDPDHEPAYSHVLDLDLSTVTPSIAGPKRPQDRIPLSQAPQAFRAVLGQYAPAGPPVGLDEAGAESFRPPPGRGYRQPGNCQKPAASARPPGRADGRGARSRPPWKTGRPWSSTTGRW